MNELLGLSENQFYKCIINNETLTFIIMTQSEIDEYKQNNERNKNVNKN